MNSVFILGAGASVHARIPTMLAFLEVVEDIQRSRHDPDFDLVVRGRSELAAVHSKSRFDVRNLESVFAAFEMAGVFGHLGQLPGPVVPTLAPALRRVIVATLEQRMILKLSGGAILPTDQYSSFAALIGELRERDEGVSIITFNYDVGLDLALRFHGFQPDYCLSDTPLLSSKAPGPVELMKLHGSVNWTQCSKCRKEILYVPMDAAVLARESQWRLEGGRMTKSASLAERLPTTQFRCGADLADLVHCGGRNSNAEPFIVPPTDDKGGIRALLSPVWRRAAARLREADNIFVIGYSWPNSDEFFRSLYALGTVGNRILRKFWVFNPDPSVRARFERDLLGPQAIERLGRTADFDVTFDRAIEWICVAAFEMSPEKIHNRVQRQQRVAEGFN